MIVGGGAKSIGLTHYWPLSKRSSTIGGRGACKRNFLPKIPLDRQKRHFPGVANSRIVSIYYTVSARKRIRLINIVAKSGGGHFVLCPPVQKVRGTCPPVPPQDRRQWCVCLVYVRLVCICLYARTSFSKR